MSSGVSHLRALLAKSESPDISAYELGSLYVAALNALPRLLDVAGAAEDIHPDYRSEHLNRALAALKEEPSTPRTTESP